MHMHMHMHMSHGGAIIQMGGARVGEGCTAWPRTLLVCEAR